MPRPSRARIPSSPALAAMGDFLNGYPWAHYCTLTFRPPEETTRVHPDVGETWGRWRRRIVDGGAGVSLDYALRHWHAFHARVRLAAAVPLFWFYGVEHGERFGRLHLHALLGNTERLPVATVKEAWTAGWSRVLEYDPTRGASYYVTKYVTKELAEWDISAAPLDARDAWRDRSRHLFRDSTTAPDPLTAAALTRLQRSPASRNPLTRQGRHDNRSNPNSANAKRVQ